MSFHFAVSISDIFPYLTHVKVLKVWINGKEHVDQLRDRLRIHARNLRRLDLVFESGFSDQHVLLKYLLENMPHGVNTLTINWGSCKDLIEMHRQLLRTRSRQEIQDRLLGKDIETLSERFDYDQDIQVTAIKPMTKEINGKPKKI